MSENGPIAVIGMALRAPGAETPEAFWQNILDRVDSLTRPTESQLRRAGVPEQLIRDPRFVRAAPLLGDVGAFDPSFFEMSALEAESTDPAHRLFMTCAWEALERTGVVPGPGAGRVGVFGGGGGFHSNYAVRHFGGPRLDLHDPAGWLPVDLGGAPEHLTSRVCFKLGLQGPNATVMAACATSLVALHLAVRALRQGDCDLALAGGANAATPHWPGYLCTEGGPVSPTGAVRAFDSRADGTVFGSGIGVVVLKRLDDAVAERDPIHGVILGTGIFNDGGERQTFTAPGVPGQVEAISRALEEAAIDPRTIGYLEAHGTGTLLGDPIEVEATSRVYREFTDEKQFCAMGTVKTNIGHSGAASGILGLIKTCMALKHGVIPPSIHFDDPNPKLDLPGSPFYVPTEVEPWPSGTGPRRAAVSAFGFGGNNAHVVLEAPPPQAEREGTRGHSVVMLSARDSAALERMEDRLADHLTGRSDLAVADVAYTLESGRKEFRRRAAVVVAHTEELRDSLAAGVPFRGDVRGQRVIFAFPGQGSQSPSMGRELYETSTLFRDEIDRCEELLAPHLSRDLRLFDDLGGEVDAELVETEVTQPALFVVEYALARLLMAHGVVPAAMIGHSIGEMVAACLADVFSLSDALALVALRGRLMQACPPGSMMAVFLPSDETKSWLGGDAEIAAVNAPGITVVSASSESIDSLGRRLDAEGVGCRRLRTSHAFHSASMEAACKPFREALAGIELSAPRIPYVSNVTGERISDQEATDPDYWAKHIRQPVLFARGVQTLLADEGAVWLEVGPGNSLSGLVRRQADEAMALPVLETIAEGRHGVKELLARLWVNGVPLDRSALLADGDKRKITLPTYPFERHSYLLKWPEFVSESAEPESAPEVPEVTEKADAPLLRVVRWNRKPLRREFEIEAGEGWLLFEDGTELGSGIAAELRASGARPLSVLAGSSFEKRSTDVYVVRPGEAEDLGRVLTDAAEVGWAPRRVLHLWQVTGEPEGSRDDSEYEEWLETGTYALCALVSALDEHGPNERVHVAVVVDGAIALEREDASDQWQKSLLNGVCRVAPREMHQLSFQLIDIPTAWREEWVVDGILAEASAPDPAPAIALREQGRNLEDYEHLADAAGGIALRPRAVVLITGAMGGLGLEVAERLFEMGEARLALLSRWEPPPRDEWPRRAEADDRVGLALRKLLDLEGRGAELLVIRGDVASEDDMAHVIGEVSRRFGAIHGVVHAAGVAEPALILEQDRRRLDRVVGPKVRGDLILERLLDQMPLDFHISFSSIASVIPARGQADYAAANAALDALARRRARREGSRACAISWDAWQDVGMAVDELREDQLTIVPESELAIGDPVSHPLWRYCRRERKRSLFVGRLSASRDWVVAEHRIQGAPVLPGTGIVEMIYAAFRHLHGDDTRAVLSDLAFLRLVEVPEDGLEVWLVCDHDGVTAEFELRSRRPSRSAQRLEDLTLHTTGTMAPLMPAADPENPIANAREEDLEPQEVTNFPRAPHWSCLRESATKNGLTVARLALPEQFHSEVEEYALHPAMLDRALGDVHFRRLDGPGVVSTIGEVRIHAPLPPEIVAEVRDAPDGGGTVSVVITDDSGRVVVEVDDYLQILYRGGSATGRGGDQRLRLAEVGHLEGLELESLDLPLPGPGEVQLEVYAAGLNFRDVLSALGALGDRSGALETLGAECSGRVVAVGSGVEEFSVGDAVVALGRGAFAARINTPVALVASKPETVSFEEAAAAPIAFLTARYALVEQARLRAGERILIHSAAGGVGLAAVQLAREIGAEIFATVGSKPRRRILREMGIEHVMSSRSLEFVDAVRECTRGTGVDVVLNSLAGESIPASLGLLAPFGRFVELGKRDILEDSQLGLQPFRNNLSLHAVDLGQLLDSRQVQLGVWLGELMEALAQKRFAAGPVLSVPWLEAQRAFERMTTPEHRGKVVLVVREPGKRSLGALSERQVRRRGLSFGIPLVQALDTLQELLQRPDLPPHVIVSLRPSELLRTGVEKTSDEESDTVERERVISESYRAPSGPVEESMARIWEGLLSVDAIGVDDDFFELGGDSITAIQILSRVRREFEVGLKHTALLEHPTVAGLARLVEQSDRGA